MSELIRIARRHEQPASSTLQSLGVDRCPAGHYWALTDERLGYESIEIGIICSGVDPGVDRREVYRLWSGVEPLEVDVLAEPRQPHPRLVDHVGDSRPPRAEVSDGDATTGLRVTGCELRSHILPNGPPSQ